MTDPTWLKAFRLVALAEGLSFLFLLLVAMPLKYGWGLPEAVRWAGMAHGMLFLGYMGLAPMLFVDRDWPWSRLPGVLIAAVLPFGTFVLERAWLREPMPPHPQG